MVITIIIVKIYHNYSAVLGSEIVLLHYIWSF